MHMIVLLPDETVYHFEYWYTMQIEKKNPEIFHISQVHPIMQLFYLIKT